MRHVPEPHLQPHRERETPQFASTAARLLASGWRLSGIFRAASGRALNITTGIPVFTGVQTTKRARTRSGRSVRRQSTGNWFNPAAFEQPAVGTHGNAGRNAYEAPGTRVLDLALVRSFRFMETHRIEARIEAFNALNWTRLGLGTDLGIR